MVKFIYTFQIIVSDKTPISESVSFGWPPFKY